MSGLVKVRVTLNSETMLLVSEGMLYIAVLVAKVVP